MEQAGIAEAFLKLLSHDRPLIRREVCCILRNVSEGTAEQINIFSRFPGFVPKLCLLALTDKPSVFKIIYLNSLPLLAKKRIYLNLIKYGEQRKA